MSRLAVIAAGGALGAVLRYLVSGWVARWSHESPFPYGTLAVNVVGSLLLGLLMGAAGDGRLLLPPLARTFLGIGVLGAFTTFSTFSYETVEALNVGDLRVAAANVAANLTVALVACRGGWEIGLRL